MIPLIPSIKKISMKTATWFFAPLDHHGIFYARILFGLAIFTGYFMRWDDVEFFWGPDGFGGKTFLETVGAPNLLSSDLGWLLANYGSQTTVWCLYFALLICSFSFMVGFRTKFTGISTLVLHILFLHRNYFAFWGWPNMMVPYLFYLLFTPCGAKLSFDAKLGSVKKNWLEFPIWPMRLLQIHICTMYLVAGWERVLQPVWYSGDAVLPALINHQFSRIQMDFVPYGDFLRPFGWLAYVTEPLAFLLWHRKIGPYLALILIGMHVFLELTTFVDQWNFMMTAGLICFLPKHWVVPRFFRRAGDETQPA